MWVTIGPEGAPTRWSMRTSIKMGVPMKSAGKASGPLLVGTAKSK